MRQASFFDVAEMAPQVRTAAPVVPRVSAEARPEGWRAPTKGDEACAACGGRAAYGLGATHLCRAHLPAGFLPGERG